MISITKGDEPESLRDNGAAWTTQLMAHVSAGTKIPDNLKNKYNQTDVREALRTECNGKCMYCESRIGHVTYDHIEHVKPKAKDKYPDLTFTWTNLGLACPMCNMNKSDDYDETAPVVNPYEDDPNRHFVAVGGFVYHRAGDVRGEMTERTIELNRSVLLEQRLERIDAVRALADRYESAAEPLKSVLRNEIRREAESDKPYSMCVKSAFNAILNDSPIVG